MLRSRALQICKFDNNMQLSALVKILKNENGLFLEYPRIEETILHSEGDLKFKFYSIADGSMWINSITLNDFACFNEDTILQTAENIKTIRKGLAKIEKNSGKYAFDSLEFTLLAYAKVLKCTNIVTLDKNGNIRKIFNLSLGCGLDDLRFYLKNG